jgi:hypothetical protein
MSKSKSVDFVSQTTTTTPAHHKVLSPFQNLKYEQSKNPTHNYTSVVYNRTKLDVQGKCVFNLAI